MDFPKCKFCGERHRNGPEWCSELKSSGGGVESRHAAGVVPEQPVHGIGSEHRVRKARNGPQAGVAPSPPEAKPKKAKPLSKAIAEGLHTESKPKKRAPRGTFDRKAYQRELMRKRRSEGK